MEPNIFLSDLDFLERVLEIVRESDADPEILYSILENNIERLDNNFARTLKDWLPTKLETLESEERCKLAKDIGNFCMIIRIFPFPSQANNIEIAIAGYELVSHVFTREDFPENWAISQSNLGAAYCSRVLGNRGENLEQGIAYFKKSLQVYTRQDWPVGWAETQNNLGNAYQERIIGEKEKNLERAIQCHKKALGIHTRTAFPQEWARIQFSLGNAYSVRILGETDKNQEKGIQHYKNALQVYNRDDYPENWAAIQDSLGSAYHECLLGEKANNLEEAIAHHKKALLVYSYEFTPAEWAMTQNNLGVAYSQRIFGKKEENLKQEIECYQNALRVYSKESFPLDHARTLYNLGLAYKICQKFDLAYTVLATGIETVESLRSLITSEDYLTTAANTLEFNPIEILSEQEAVQEVQQKFAEDWNLLYQAMVEVCLELGYGERALEYVESSKNRNLIEFIAQKDSQSNFQTIRFSQIIDILPDERTSIVEWYITPETLVVFIISSQTQNPIVWQPILEEREGVLQSLIDWGNKYLDDYEDDGEGGERWIKQLDDSLHNLALILDFDEILSLLPVNCDRLILIPHWFLHLLPLHALPIKTRNSSRNPQYLLDRFSRGICYAPSCQLLYTTQNNPRHQPTSDGLLPHFLAIQNPTDDLPYADVEVQSIQRYFRQTKILAKSQATKESFCQELSKNSTTGNYIHFSGHGFFNPNFTLKSSALFFADCYTPADSELLNSKLYLMFDESDQTKIALDCCLTLREIYTLTLPQCHLITLSACESGVTNFYNTSDEYIGIGGGFLYAGAANVVSSLWVVNDLSTAFLMFQFYQNLQTISSVAVALNQAQIWLRDISKKELKTWIDQQQLNLSPALKMSFNRRLNKMSDDARPFKSPFYWAAFCAIGRE